MEAALQMAQEGQPLLAAQHLAVAAEAGPDRPELWTEAARYALMADSPQDAIHYLEQHPQPGEIEHMLFGEAYQEIGDLAQADLHYEQAIQLGGDALDLYQRRLALHRAQHDLNAIQQDLRALLALQPNDPEYNYELGLLLAATQPEAALPYWVLAAEIDPGYDKARLVLAEALRTARFYDDPAYTALASGRVLASLGAWDLARTAFETAIASNSAFGEAWAYLAEAKQQNGEDGYNELQQALLLDGNSVAVNMLAALYWQRKEEYDQALAYLDRAAQLEPDNPVIVAEIANTYSAKGDLPTAESYYHQAIDLAPTESAYRRLLAEFSLTNNIQLHDTGLMAARQAVLLESDNPDNLLTLGRVLLALDDIHTAQRFLLQAAELAPEDPRVLLYLGQGYWMLGDRENAHIQWESVLELAPDTSIAEEAQRWLEK